MCRSQAEGGQRCSASTRASVEAAERTLAQIEEHFSQIRTSDGPPDRDALARVAAQREDARRALDEAHAAHASTREGEREYQQALDAARAPKADTGDAAEDARRFAADVEEETRLTRILRRGAEMRETSRLLFELARLRRTATPVTPQSMAYDLGGSALDVTAHQGTPSVAGGPAHIVHVSATTIRWTQDGLTHTSLLGNAIYARDNEYVIANENGPLLTFTKRA